MKCSELSILKFQLLLDLYFKFTQMYSELLYKDLVPNLII